MYFPVSGVDDRDVIFAISTLTGPPKLERGGHACLRRDCPSDVCLSFNVSCRILRSLFWIRKAEAAGSRICFPTTLRCLWRRLWSDRSRVEGDGERVEAPLGVIVLSGRDSMCSCAAQLLSKMSGMSPPALPVDAGLSLSGERRLVGAC